MGAIFPILFIAGIILFIVLSIIFNEEARVKRKLKKLSYKRIADYFDNEMGKVVGRVDASSSNLRAPISTRNCVGFHVVVEQKKSSGKSSSWHTIIDQKVFRDFTIIDRGQKALIRTDNLKIAIDKDREYDSGFMNDATPQLVDFLKKHGVDSEGLFGFNKSLRYKEGIIERDEPVAVYGQVKWLNRNGFDDKEAILEVHSTEKESVYLSDDRSTVSNRE